MASPVEITITYLSYIETIPHPGRRAKAIPIAPNIRAMIHDDDRPRADVRQTLQGLDLFVVITLDVPNE
jgi:hypothetical protein